MGDLLSVGVIGAGDIAREHIRGIEANDNIQMVAIMDVDADKSKAVGGEYGVKHYTDLQALLEDQNVEAVHICTPHKFHGEQVLAAARSGKHILVEKPMALTLDECDRMIEACENNEKVLMVGQVLRHYPVNLKARELILEGAIGQVGHMMRRRYTYFNPVMKGGRKRSWYMDLNLGGICVLYSFGPHEYDILHWYIDSPVQEVYAIGTESTEIYRGQKDSYTTVMTHENGVVSVLSQSIVCHNGSNDQYIVGSEGSIAMTNQNLTLNGENIPIGETLEVGMANQIREFATCCLEGNVPDANGKSVRHTMEVIEAVKKSSERNAPVRISELNC